MAKQPSSASRRPPNALSISRRKRSRPRGAAQPGGGPRELGPLHEASPATAAAGLQACWPPGARDRQCAYFGVRKRWSDTLHRKLETMLNDVLAGFAAYAA